MLSRVAIAQMNSTPDVARNLRSVEALVQQASEQGASLLILPEGFAYIGPEKDRRPIEEDLSTPGPILTTCQELSQRHNLDLVLAGFWEKAEQNKAFNSCVYLNADGSIQSVYRKVHLFDVDLSDGSTFRESETIARGHDVVVSDAPFGKLGLSICYDLRFPELYRLLVDKGAVAIAVPAAFTFVTGADHWHVLLRARAIESQCYVFAAAQVGHHYGTRRSYGHALICDPWGEIIAQCSEGESIAVTSVDLSWVKEVRRRIPCLEHRSFSVQGLKP